MFAFDDIQVYPDAFRAEKSGNPLALEPKAIRVLIYLIENRHRAVDKKELIRQNWDDAAVGDNALTRVIVQLRRALGDNVREPKYIETIPTVGYRFIASVALEPAASAAIKPVLRFNRWIPAAALAVIALAALLYLIPKERAFVPVPRSRLSQITFSGGYDIGSSFSPDGGSLTYASDRTGTFEIYAKSLAVGGSEIQLTHDGSQNIQPAWSPDGRLIAYHSVLHGGIYVVPALGGVPVRISEFGSEPAWSPDGKCIVFCSHDGHWIPGSAPNVNPASVLWIVSVDGSGRRQLTNRNTARGGHTNPSFSHDGRRILFASHGSDGRTGLWRIDSGGTSPLLISSVFDDVRDSKFTPDGEGIVVAGGKSGDLGIWLLRLGNARDEPVLLIRTQPSLPAGLATSHDGLHIAYTTSEILSNLSALPLNPRTGMPVGGTTNVTWDKSMRNTLPAFSPDGRHLAWSVNRSGQPSKIWVGDADGQNAAPVVGTTTSDTMPNWLPDGSGLVYNSPGKGLDLKVVKLADRTPHEFGCTGSCSSIVLRSASFPRLSPDGKQVAFQSVREGAMNIWKMQASGEPPLQMTHDPESAGYPVWSPDGKWLGVELRRGDGTQIGIMPASGGQLRSLTQEAGEAWLYSWSPDSTKIAFAGYRNAVWNLYWVSIVDGHIQQLTNYSNAAGFVRYPGWSPLGDRLIFEESESHGNIFQLAFAAPLR